MFVFCIGIYFICASLCASAPAIVSVQAGDHPEFVRLSLSWPQPVSFDYVRTATGFEIRFFQKSELLLDRLVTIFPGSSYRHEGNQTVLNIHVSPTRKFIAKSYGNITYLDIYKEGVQDLKLVPHPGIKKSYSAASPKKAETKTVDVDLHNLFKKVADYLGELKPDLEATILMHKDNGILLKYPEVPIAVYENEQKVFIVVLKDEYPVLAKQLEQKYSIQLTQSKGAFVLQMPAKDFTNPIVTKESDGWHIEFIAALPSGKSPQFFVKENDAKIKMNRAGLFDPVDVGGVSVFCTLIPDVFVPIHFERENMTVLATSAGAAFKTDAPEKIEVDRDFITLLTEGGVPPQETSKKIDFSRIDPKKNFMAQKQKLLGGIVGTEGKDIQAHLDLIQLYLSRAFSSEAASEIKALHQGEKDIDPELAALLGCVGEIAENGTNQEPIAKLFPFHKNDLESAAWCAFGLAQLYGQPIPNYLGEHLAGLIDSFPDPLKSTLFLNLADKLILQSGIDLAESLIQKINEAQLSSELVFLKQFLQTKINKIKHNKIDIEECKRLLSQTQYPLLEVRLIIESGLVDLKKQSHIQYIENLEIVLPLIEGDLYHPTALLYLIDYYFTVKDYFKALDLIITLKKLYRGAYTEIRPKIQGVLYALIRDKQLEAKGPTYTLTVLNQFVDDIPSGSQMAHFILSLTEKLHRIGLLEESIQLIESYIKRPDVGLSPKKQMEFLFQLIDFYIKKEDEQKAKSLIEEIEKNGDLPKDALEKNQVFKARIALINNNNEEALTFLQTNHSLEGLKLKSALLWEQGNWSGVADVLEELIDTHGSQLDSERKERYIVHLAAALVLNEEKYRTKNIGRQKTRVTLQGALQKYEGVLSKYKILFQELTTEPHNSMTEALSRSVIINEINETNRLENLFNQLKAVPTN